MNCQTARESFSDLLDARIQPGEQPPAQSAALAAVREHLSTCPACQREFATLAQTLAVLDTLPTPAAPASLRRDFYAMLEDEKRTTAAAVPPPRVQHHVAWWRWVLGPVGACALLAFGFVAGTHYGTMPSPPTTAPALAQTERELQDLRAKYDQLSMANQLVEASLNRQQLPANERLQTVLTTSTQENPSDRIINELITSLALDSSPNVRLRALEALYPHSDKEVVRTAVLISLPRESNPLVQVAMIDFLAAARDHEAKPALEKMMTSDHTDENVRVAAKRAVAQL